MIIINRLLGGIVAIVIAIILAIIIAPTIRYLWDPNMNFIGMLLILSPAFFIIGIIGIGISVIYSAVIYSAFEK